MTNPINDIEQKQANFDMGRLAVQIFQGAQSESDSWIEGFWATVAFFAAMFRQEPNSEETT